MAGVVDSIKQASKIRPFGLIAAPIQAVFYDA
jgi:hypothetical protein